MPLRPPLEVVEYGRLATIAEQRQCSVIEAWAVVKALGLAAAEAGAQPEEVYSQQLVTNRPAEGLLLTKAAHGLSHENAPLSRQSSEVGRLGVQDAAVSHSTSND